MSPRRGGREGEREGGSTRLNDMERRRDKKGREGGREGGVLT